MKLVVGLGNIGKEYDKTRHNVGFMVIDKYLQDKNIMGKFKEKMNAYYLETMINNEKVIFVKPTTYMNNSGLAVRQFVDFYKISISDILIISDDLDLQLGSFRLRCKGSSGGHNGLKSIISSLGDDNFKRLRVGISNDKNDVINYVLSKFKKSEMVVLNDLFLTLENVLDDFFEKDFIALMNIYNKRG